MNGQMHACTPVHVHTLWREAGMGTFQPFYFSGTQQTLPSGRGTLWTRPETPTVQSLKKEIVFLFSKIQTDSEDGDREMEK